MEIDRTKFLAAVFVATFLMAVAAGAVVMLDSKPKASTTSINVHNIASAYMFPMPGELGEVETLQEYYSTFQLDIEHRQYGRFYVARGETKYMVLNFTIYVDEIWGEFEMMAVPRIDFVMNATEFGMPSPMLEMSSYWEPTGFMAEVDKLPEGCTLDLKYVICDSYGYSSQEGPNVEHDPASVVVVVSFTASEDRTWSVRDPKVYLANLLVMSDTEAPIMFHGPMVSVHVEEMLMSYDDFWDWAWEIHYD